MNAFQTWGVVSFNKDTDIKEFFLGKTDLSYHIIEEAVSDNVKLDADNFNEGKDMEEKSV